LYQVGFGISDITALRHGYAMHGFGMWFHRQQGVRNQLCARFFYFEDDKGAAVVYGCLELGYITRALREKFVEELVQEYPHIDPEGVVLTCTHTHSAPGGLAHEPLYNLVTPGFQPDVLEEIVSSAMVAFREAYQSAKYRDISFARGAIPETVPVAWNRSIQAFNLNKDITSRNPNDCHKALNREMDLLTIKEQEKEEDKETPVALLSWFGVHATCLGNKLSLLDGDNKGYASRYTEDKLPEKGVALFAQSACGDVSPHYHGPGQRLQRKRIKGEDEYEYARQNGIYQAEHALKLMAGKSQLDIKGDIDYAMFYIDFSDIHVDPEYAEGNRRAFTSEPCHGVPFFGGTPVDGPGVPPPVTNMASSMARGVKFRRMRNLPSYPSWKQDYYRRIYSAQDEKNILLESGYTQRRALGLPLDHYLIPGKVDPVVAELKHQYKIGALKEHALVPYVLPIQIILLGNLALICCPGEFTGVAGQRVVDVVKPVLKQKGVEEVIFSSYCNDYMGYVNTPEEYAAQTYEGGHNIFGKWSLGAFQMQLKKLSEEMFRPRNERRLNNEAKPPHYSPEELGLRSRLLPR